MLKGANLWFNKAQWLVHPRIMSHIIAARQGSIDWHGVYSTPDPASPTFFMEGYTGPTPPIPPSHIIQVLTQSAPTLPPRDRSVPPIQKPVQSKSVDPPVESKSEPPVPESVEPPPTPLLVEPPAPVSVEPSAPMSVETPLILEQPAPVSVSKPKAKPHKKKPEAGPSQQSRQPTLAPKAPSKGKRGKGESIEAGPKKTRIISKEYIESSDEEMEPEIKLGLTELKKPKTKMYVEIVTKPPSHLQCRANKMELRPKSEPRPRAPSQIKSESESGEEISPKPKLRRS